MAGDPTKLDLALAEASAGDADAVNRLVTLLYHELRALAGSFFKGEDQAHTLQPTALVHEAWIRLRRRPRGSWNDRKHFIQAAAIAMRMLLTDHARRRRAVKRGGGRAKVTMNTNLIADELIDVDLVVLDECLARLSSLNQRQGQIVEMRFLMGFSVEETAKVIEVSPRTVELDSRMALAWLRRDLERSGERDG